MLHVGGGGYHPPVLMGLLFYPGDSVQAADFHSLAVHDISFPFSSPACDFIVV